MAHALKKIGEKILLTGEVGYYPLLFSARPGRRASHRVDVDQERKRFDRPDWMAPPGVGRSRSISNRRLLSPIVTC